MVKIEVYEINFDQESFAIQYDAFCKNCGKIIYNKTTRMQRLARFAVGCQQCENFPSFNTETLPYLIDRVISWGYEPEDVQRVAQKLLSYDKET